jgi:FtsH-binding integral membrane protein
MNNLYSVASNTGSRFYGLTNNVGNRLDQYLNNEYLLIVLGLVVALYGANARVNLPTFVRNLFNNNIFRVVFLSLLLIYRLDKAPHVALAVALIFTLVMYSISEKEKQENFDIVADRRRRY